MIANGCIKLFVVCLVVLVAWSGGFQIEQARAAGATFGITPGGGEFKVGQTITALVIIHSGGNVINAAEATINFPSDLLDAISISKTGSIFTLWPEEPTFDNARGVISFVGGVTPPVAVSNGRVISVNFRVRAGGEATVNFSGARILLADGKGTNIYSGAQGAAWKLTFVAPARTPTPVPPAVGTLNAPKVVSSTHPDSEKWYSNKNPKFSWTLPLGITGVNILGDRNPSTDPGTQSDGIIDSYEYFDVDDGIWYFHVKLRNSAGWGSISHFRFQIDTKPPQPFTVKLVEDTITDQSHPKISFLAEDKLSGIDRYEIRIDKGNWLDASTFKDDESYILPKQSAGDHRVDVRALDKAGNTKEESLTFIVAVAPPRILSYLSKFLLYILLGIAIALVTYLLLRLLRLKKNIGKDVLEAERSLHRAFDLLRDNVKSQIQLLEKARTKRELTNEENKILTHLKDHLDKAEKLIKKKIGNISDSV